MSAILRDLWPEDIQSEDVVSPEEILNHQSEQLEARTNGVLIAHVTKVSTDDRVILGFEVESPRAGIRIHLLGAQHRPEFEYPVLIVPPDGTLPDYLKERVYQPSTSTLPRMLPSQLAAVAKTFSEMSGGKWIDNEWVATSPAEFSQQIEAILRQPFVKAAVLSLLAKANRDSNRTATATPSE